MPYLRLSSNVEIDPDTSGQLVAGLSQVLAKETGKSERYVMVELVAGSTLLFAANPEPLAYLECKSIGLTAAQAKALSAAIGQLLGTSLAIPAERIYIEFSNCPAEFWGWNGSTFG